MILIDKKKVVTNAFMLIAITAMIGGFLLGVFNDDIDESEDESEEEVVDYTGRLDQSSVGDSLSVNHDDENEDEENHEETEERIPDEDGSILTDEDRAILEEAEEAGERIEEYQDMHGDHHEHEDGGEVHFLDKYADEYGEKTVERLVNISYDAVFLMQSNTTDPSEWEGIASQNMLENVLEMDREVAFFDFEIMNFDLLPVEDSEGIVVGVMIETLQDVLFLQFDFVIEGDEPLLDDISTIWHR